MIARLEWRAASQTTALATAFVSSQIAHGALSFGEKCSISEKLNLFVLFSVFIHDRSLFPTPEVNPALNDFETLLAPCLGALERFVRFRISPRADADDVLQEICLAAYRSFPSLRDPVRFKSWLLRIAQSKCTDYFRARTKILEIPLESICEPATVMTRYGPGSAVEETFERLASKDQQILYLAYWKDMPHAEIAKTLSIPVGTVKSRLHAAREKFKAAYPCPPRNQQGVEPIMSKTHLPEILPPYTIKRSDLPPFPVRCEELMGWNIVPRLGEKLSWGLYDMPSRCRTEYTDMEVVGRAQVHGIEGVEILAVQHDAENYYRTGSVNEMERRFVAQLTDTHCRYLAESHVENGVRKCYTFLDGDSFLDNWGFGPDNCGSEIAIAPKGLLRREGNTITGTLPCGQLDIVGRYTVTLGGRAYDTVCVMDIECFNDAIASEQYVDANGRTVLWRRFNRNDWAYKRYGAPWTQLLPQNERLCINDETYVHWYDCVTDYVL